MNRIYKMMAIIAILGVLAGCKCEKSEYRTNYESTYLESK